MNGFRQYFEHQTQSIPFSTGKEELSRLSKSHFLLTVPSEPEKIFDYLRGTEGLRYIDPQMIRTVEDIQINQNPFIVILIPKRWFGKTQLENGIPQAIGQLIPYGEGHKIPKNYIWGYFSNGEFQRHFNYHAPDALYERWRRDHPTQTRFQDRSRIEMPYSPKGYKTFVL